MSVDTVSVVIATYNQPTSLTSAIESALRQDAPPLEVLVIGDSCGAETAAAVADFEDPSIRYVNLPQRTGEQSVPNSVGMAVARGRRIALLNQDDVWLPDHLAVADRDLKQTDASLFTGRAAFYNPTRAGTADFTGVSPLNRALADAYHSPNRLFEPCSSWVFDRDIFDTVGAWQPASTLYRTPLADWILRCARARSDIATVPR